MTSGGGGAGHGQHWDPDRYRREAGFVAELGRPLLELLQPQAGECILDLGCGDGRLTAELADAGADVAGSDLSVEQVTAARRLGLAVCAADGHALPFKDDAFDAVLSNAALHWMQKPDAVLAEVRRVLKPGGRFIAEMGGAGNVARIVGAVASAMAQRALDFSAAWPWYFPAPDAYREKLQAVGFTVERMEHFPRPTPLPADISGWLATFAESFLSHVPPDQRDAFIAEVRAALQVHQRDESGQWSADYVRLRFKAVLAD
ncbi:class I SAM-dependent methyltransferase [Ferruginivarius sediminum]|uniref:SAM-dependent methyltransferase n=1 Tax=Ferruginivarius sediminum TaxID=2661937 RepID=A0A369TCI4_9PROT|nr:class I SAM-dependent methyltransferase [Ferruginivarius sediminum]RDD63019.1 SAM-dependent methyltransferase [Ferruginivarius sediminum]